MSQGAATEPWMVLKVFFPVVIAQQTIFTVNKNLNALPKKLFLINLKKKLNLMISRVLCQLPNKLITKYKFKSLSTTFIVRLTNNHNQFFCAHCTHILYTATYVIVNL